MAGYGRFGRWPPSLPVVTRRSASVRAGGRELVERERRAANLPALEASDRTRQMDRRGFVVDVDDDALQAPEGPRAGRTGDPNTVADAERSQRSRGANDV